MSFPILFDSSVQTKYTINYVPHSFFTCMRFLFLLSRQDNNLYILQLLNPTSSVIKIRRKKKKKKSFLIGYFELSKPCFLLICYANMINFAIGICFRVLKDNFITSSLMFQCYCDQFLSCSQFSYPSIVAPTKVIKCITNKDNFTIKYISLTSQQNYYTLTNAVWNIRTLLISKCTVKNNCIR